MILSKLEDCFKRGQLRSVQPSHEKAISSMKEARIWVEESRKAISSGANRSAFISIYLVYFHSARSILFNDGIREKSHYCIGVYLEYLVEKKKLEPKWPMLFHVIRQQRHSTQYSFNIEPSEDEIDYQLKEAIIFLDRMGDLIDL